MDCNVSHFTHDERLSLSNSNGPASFMSSSAVSSSPSSSPFPSWLVQHDNNEHISSSHMAMESLPAVIYGILSTAIILLFSLFWQVQRKIAYSDWIRKYKPSSKQRNGSLAGAIRPPSVKGNFLLGNGREFSKDAAAFLSRVGREYGDMATIKLMFRKIVVLNDVHTFPAFGREARFDFRPIVDQVNLNVFGYKVANVDDHKRRLLSFYKSSRMHDTVVNFDYQLSQSMAAYGSSRPRGEVLANDFVVDTGFSAVFRTLLGGSANEDDPSSKDYALFYSNYGKFMKYFNFLWLGLPLKMFPVASRAFTEMVRAHPKVSGMPVDEGVCGYLRKACETMIAEGHNDAEVIGHNVEFIHVHINALRVAYWMMLFTVADPKAYEALLEQIDEIVQQRRATSDPDASTVHIGLEDVEAMTALDSIFTETLRLISGVLVIRGITQDVQMKTSSGTTYDLRRGETVLFYPPVHHLDPEIFQNPTDFVWDRFIGTSFSKNGRPIDKPVMGFGTICIGQRFASFVAKWYLVNILYRWRIRLAGPVPEIDFAYQGHEILPPKCDTKIEYEPRPESCNVRLEMAISSSIRSNPKASEAMTMCVTKLADEPPSSISSYIHSSASEY